ncbi:MAG: MFS transporter [Desulfobacterales bacterium]|nr:MFS transporter [Desulfobacterales bacterium]
MRLIALAYLAHFLRHGMVFPLIPLFAQRMVDSDIMIGAAVGGFSLLSLLLALPMGSLSDRLSARSLLLLSAFFNLVYSLLLIVAHNIWMLISAQMIGGLGFLLLIISSQTWVSEHAEKGMRERGFGFLSLAAAVGQTIGPFLGGFILSRTSFTAVFSLAVLFCLPGFSAAGLRDENRGRKKVSARERGRLRKLLIGLAADPKMCVVLILTFVAVFAANLRSSFVPVLFKAQGMDEGTIGLLLSLFALSMTLVRLVIGRVMGVVSRKGLFGLALALIFVATAALPSISRVYISAGVMLLFGMGFGISQPLSMVMVSDRAGETSGLAMGARFFVITLATMFSPLLTGLVVEGFGLAAAFYCVAGMLLAAGVLIRLVAANKP